VIDSHAHLEMPEFAVDRAAVVDRALAGGLTRILTVGTDVESSAAAVELSGRQPGGFCGRRLSSHLAGRCGRAELEELVRIASAPKVAAWGEIGLDYFRNPAAREEQRTLFEAQLAIAGDLALPVVIHDRRGPSGPAGGPATHRQGRAQGGRALLLGDAELAADLLDLGYFISIPGTVTYPKASGIRAVAAAVPLGGMLIETDAPYLAPVPLRGKRNEPPSSPTQLARSRASGASRSRKSPGGPPENARALFGWPRG